MASEYAIDYEPVDGEYKVWQVGKGCIDSNRSMALLKVPDGAVMTKRAIRQYASSNCDGVA